MQLYARPEYHGRIFALEFGLMTLAFASMSWLMGGLLDGGVLDPRGVARVSGLVLCVPFLLWAGFLVYMRRRLRLAAQGVVSMPAGIMERSP